MNGKNLLALMLALLPVIAHAQSNQYGTDNMVKLTTSHGEIVLELYPEDAPVTVQNFIDYVESGFYEGTLFHRVIPGFVIQGGGLDGDMRQKPNNPPIVNEADNGLKNETGTLSMARTSDPNSATSQFFINLADNAFLDFTSKTAQGWGYAVFAKVTSGMDVVEAIAGVSTGNKGMHSDVPLEPVVIHKAEVVTGQ